MRRLVIVLVLVVCAVGGWFGWRAWRKPTDATVIATTAVSVERGVIQRAVAATGRVVSNLDVDIKCKASGVVVKLPFDISDRVKQGELVVELDPIDEQRAVARSAAELDASQARLEQSRRALVIAEATLVTTTGRAKANLAAAAFRARDARAKAERMAELLKKHLVSQEDADTAATSAQQADSDLATAQVAVDEVKTLELNLELKRQDIRLAEASVASNQIALDNAKQRLKETTVLAPMEGVVTARTVQIGTIISSGITNVGGGTAALTISDLSRIFVLAAVDESDIGQVALGQTVRITADAFPGRTFAGTVMRIAARGVNASNVVTFEVKIEVTGEGKASLKPEMTTNVEVVVERKEDVVTVPAEALTRTKDREKEKSGKDGKDGKDAGAGKDAVAEPGRGRRERGGWTVQVAGADGTGVERAVKIGMTDGTRTEITEGLKEGEQILVRKNEPASQWRPSGPPMMGMPMGRRAH